MRHVSLMIGCLAATAGPALADQCSWNPKPIADKALTYLRAGTTVQEFCRSCDDKKAKKIVISSAEAKPVEKDYYQVSLNGQAVDLAYMFVQQKGSKTWSNLGSILKCDKEFDDKTLPASLVEG